MNKALRFAAFGGTITLEGGISREVVPEQSGHTSTAMTLNTYAHILPHTQDKVEELLFSATT
jgi:integrase